VSGGAETKTEQTRQTERLECRSQVPRCVAPPLAAQRACPCRRPEHSTVWAGFGPAAGPPSEPAGYCSAVCSYNGMLGRLPPRRRGGGSLHSRRQGGSCASREDKAACEAAADCQWKAGTVWGGTCFSTGVDCSEFSALSDNEQACTGAGCIWEAGRAFGGTCSSSELTCDDLSSDEDACTGAGCKWEQGLAYGGTCSTAEIACADFTSNADNRVACTRVAGCSWEAGLAYGGTCSGVPEAQGGASDDTHPCRQKNLTKTTAYECCLEDPEAEAGKCDDTMAKKDVLVQCREQESSSSSADFCDVVTEDYIFECLRIKCAYICALNTNCIFKGADETCMCSWVGCKCGDPAENATGNKPHATPGTLKSHRDWQLCTIGCW